MVSKIYTGEQLENMATFGKTASKRKFARHTIALINEKYGSVGPGTRYYNRGKGDVVTFSPSLDRARIAETHGKRFSISGSRAHMGDERRQAQHDT